MTKRVYAKWAGVGLVVLANVVMALWFWGRAPDPIIDFGREIYMPWRILEGQHLYRDFTYFNGPFSPYFNALVFKIFGVSLQTLTITNLVLAMGMTALLYRFMLELGDRWSAAIALFTMPFVFTFAQLNGVPNFNWITPYSHDLTHGIILGLSMIAAIWMYTRRRNMIWIANAGLLLGFVFLTKAEVFLAALLASIAGLVLAMWSETVPKRGWLALANFVITALIPPIVAFALLKAILPTHDVVLALEGSWHWLGNQQLLSLRYFKLINGTDHLGQSLTTTALWTAAYGAIAVFTAVIGSRLRKSSLKRPELIAICAFVAGLVLWIFWMRVWENFLRPMQLLVAIYGVYLLWRIAQSRRDRAALATIALPIMLAIFAGALLGKILWNVRAVHYGFALSLPATLLVINGLVYAGSRFADARGGSPQFVRAIWAALVLVGCYAHFRVDYAYFTKKDHVVSAGSDAFLADIRGKMINDACDYLLEHTSPDTTVLAMPEGFLLNYLSRRVNPTIYHQFTPPNLIMYGEENILAELKKHPPDVIALVHVDNIEYDARFLGRDYGKDIWAWVVTNYTPMKKSNGEDALFGYPPFVNEKSGVLIVARNR
jgi:hypothetical protein